MDPKSIAEKLDESAALADADRRHMVTLLEHAAHRLLDHGDAEGAQVIMDGLRKLPSVIARGVTL